MTRADEEAQPLFDNHTAPTQTPHGNEGQDDTILLEGRGRQQGEKGNEPPEAD
jgi:hypothetical protein